MIDHDALAAYLRANDALLERARQGLRASVALKYPDGSSGQGYDEYISAAPMRLREVRPSYEAIAVGDAICRRDKDAAMNCEQGEFYLGLRAIEESGVRRAQSSFADCGNSRCRRIDIEQEDAAPEELAQLFAGQPMVMVNPDRYVISLLIREDGLPYALTESKWSGADMTGPLSTYRFDYETPVKPIELPEE